MESLSKKFVLITVLLQLCLHISAAPYKTNNPKFGDILQFNTRTPCGVKIGSHYAIFVGDKTIKGKNINENIFDMTKSEDGTSGCSFRELKLRNVTVNNYLDDKVKPDDNAIIAALTKLNNNCGKWSWTNTCEHIATHVRYGEANAQCNQKGTLAAAICPFINLVTSVKKSIKKHAAAKAA